MKFVKYDITFETEREVFVTYGAPPHVDCLVKFNHITFLEDECVQELSFERETEVLIYMIKRGNFLSGILDSILKNEKVIILRNNIKFFSSNDVINLLKS